VDFCSTDFSEFCLGYVLHQYKRIPAKVFNGWNFIQKLGSAYALISLKIFFSSEIELRYIIAKWQLHVVPKPYSHRAKAGKDTTQSPSQRSEPNITAELPELIVNERFDRVVASNVLTGPSRLLPFTRAVGPVSFSMLGSPLGCMVPFLISRT